MDDSLMFERKNGFSDIEEDFRNSIFDFCDEYKDVLNKAKTEREFCSFAVETLERAGFEKLSDKVKLSTGDKVYYVNRGKSVAAFVIGSENITNGVNIVAAHIDSPRLDLKPMPLYEQEGFAFLKTHYYGGIKKFHWYNIPLSIHGVVVKKDGSVLNITFGEDLAEPVLCITDLLPHLSGMYNSKSISEAFEAEKLNVIAGNIPCEEAEKDKVKYGVLKLLNRKYGISEGDFLSGELEIVPALSARDMGFDSSMITGYGQDDRVCAYTALRAITEIEKPQRTAVCLFVDKEEIGSMGNTGAQSRNFENILAKVCSLCGEYNDLVLRECLSNSRCLSADVGAAYDPNFAEVFDARNSARINEGLVIMKCVASAAKSGSNDGNAEFVADVRRIFDENDVQWQIGEYGKVDLCNVGTISKFMANLGADVIDCGVPVLAMHSPAEVTGKFDIYMAYKGYKVFLNS